MPKKQYKKNDDDNLSIIMRLYRAHDLDLIALYLNPGFKFAKAVKIAVRSYVRGDMTKIKLPEDTADMKGERAQKFGKADKINKRRIEARKKAAERDGIPYDPSDTSFLIKNRLGIPYKYQLNLRFDRGDGDGDVIDWFRRFDPGYRNSLLKNILRQQLAGICVSLYTSDEGNAALGDEVNGLYESNSVAGVETVDGKKTKTAQKAAVTEIAPQPAATVHKPDPVSPADPEPARAIQTARATVVNTVPGKQDGLAGIPDTGQKYTGNVSMQDSSSSEDDGEFDLAGALAGMMG